MLWFWHMLGGSWVSVLWKKKVVSSIGQSIHFPYGNYYCQDTEEVQSTQGDSHNGFEIHICKLIPLRKESGQG